MESIDKWERSYMEKELAYRHDERKASIAAAQAIGMAYAKSQPTPIYRVNVW